jgi:hypothetical protein
MTLVAEWARAFDELSGEYKEESEKSKSEKAKEKQLEKSQTALPSFHQQTLQSMKGYKNWVTKRLWVGFSAHSIVNIFMSNHSDTFSMGDKMFVQTNVFVMMLSFAIWFYFSKATNCCEERKIYLGYTD